MGFQDSMKKTNAFLGPQKKKNQKENCILSRCHRVTSTMLGLNCVAFHRKLR